MSSKRTSSNPKWKNFKVCAVFGANEGGEESSGGFSGRISKISSKKEN